MINLELEIIKSATFNRDAFIEVVNNAELFTTYGELIAILQELDDEGLSFDMPSIYTRLKSKMPDGKVNAIVSDFARCNGSTVNYRDHIRQLSKQRNGEKIRDLAVDIMNAATKKTMTIQQVQEHIESIIEKLHDYSAVTDETVSDFAGRDLDDIYNKSLIHKTGIDEIDEKINGVANGDVVIIAARPSQGKTALSLQIAEYLSKHGLSGRGPILMFSLETKKRNLYARLLSRRARVESWKIQHKKTDTDEAMRVIEAHQHFRAGQYNILMFDDVMDMAGIRKKIKRYRNASAIIVDYLQLIGGGSGKTREQEVASISREFKTIAQSLDIPVVLLSQMSRAIEVANREPQLSDLRESGAIEQDANVVIFIHADETQKHLKVCESSFIIAKNKDGATGKVLTTFEKPYFTFGRKLSSMDWTNN